MKLALSLIFAGASHGIQLPRLQKGVHIIKTTEDVLHSLPRMRRQNDYDDEDYEGTADDLASPEMSPERQRQSEQLFNSLVNKQSNAREEPFKAVDSFISNLFDNKRDDPVALPGEIDSDSPDIQRNAQRDEMFHSFLQQNPTGIAPAAAPSNLLSDLYDPVYEEGPLLCRKTRQTEDKGIGAGYAPLHVKPIGCCPNNEDGKPFGPGKACCCGQVYNTTSHFCCDQSRGQCTEGEWQILEDKPHNRKQCYETQTCDRELVTNLVELSCTDGLYHGSVCDFTCPNGFDLAGVSQASCDPKTGDWNNIWGQVIDQTPCCKRKCDTKDPNYKLDFFIILDQSSSIGAENFQKMKNFVNNLLLQSNLGQTGVRVGLITYNRRPQLRFHMNEMKNHEQAIAAVDSIVYTGRGTNTGLAIKWVVDNAFKPEFGDRPEVPNKVLLITDGRARDPPVLKVQSGRLQEQATVYALGIGKQIDYVELNRIASKPSERHVLYVDSFSFLERAQINKKPTLSSIFCDEICVK